MELDKDLVIILLIVIVGPALMLWPLYYMYEVTRDPVVAWHSFILAIINLGVASLVPKYRELLYIYYLLLLLSAVGAALTEPPTAKVPLIDPTGKSTVEGLADMWANAALILFLGPGIIANYYFYTIVTHVGLITYYLLLLSMAAGITIYALVFGNK